MQLPSTYNSHTPDDLSEIVTAFLKKYPTPGVFLLKGEMGAGKTTFIRALCDQLGATTASSPTFSLVNEYVLPDGSPIYHFDLYRLNNLDEALDLGIEEYLDSGAFIFIEWPEVILPLLQQQPFYIIHIQDNDGERRIGF